MKLLEQIPLGLCSTRSGGARGVVAVVAVACFDSNILNESGLVVAPLEAILCHHLDRA